VTPVARGAPARGAGVAALPLDDDLVLYAQGGERAFVLNPTAAQVWSLCDGTRTVESIAEEIAAGRAVEYERALDDVRAFIAHLRRAGLLA
jgi:pyrroloquinoline quinone biosynthesis protein D